MPITDERLRATIKSVQSFRRRADPKDTLAIFEDRGGPWTAQAVRIVWVVLIYRKLLSCRVKTGDSSPKRSHPEHPLLILVNSMYIVPHVYSLGLVDLDAVAIILAQALRAEPHETLAVLDDAIHAGVRQTIFL